MRAQFRNESSPGSMSPQKAQTIQAQADRYVNEAVRDMDAAVSSDSPEDLAPLRLAQTWCRLIHRDDSERFSHACDVAVGMYRILRYFGGDQEDGRLGMIIGLLHEIKMPYSKLNRSDDDIADKFSPFVMDVIRNVTWKNHITASPDDYINFMDCVGRPRGDHQWGIQEKTDLWSWVFLSVHEQLAGIKLQGQLTPEQENMRCLAVGLMNARIRRRLVDRDETFLWLEQYIQESSKPATHPHP